MTPHPDLESEQAHLDHAYACLEASRDDAERLRRLAQVGQGGTHQARYERDVIEEAVRTRLADLDGAETALVFGRIDRRAEPPVEGIESFHIGRLAVADDDHEPVVVDWRAPVAEPFYRATGRRPMGLVRRRHFATRGRRIVEMEDELFGEGHLGIGGEGAEGLRGRSTLLAALEQSRVGQLGDIVATIQAEQDEIIRSPLAGVLVVQGGPGTGKTVVALHRAAYLLYTHRFPLEDQGVLVIGPNRLFLRYIERVLPSLGESGVEQSVLADLVPDVVLASEPDAREVAKIKGDARMAAVIAKAARDRGRPLRDDLLVPFGTTYLRLRAQDTVRIVAAARRRYRRHNGARKFVESEVWAALAASSRDEIAPDAVKERVRHLDEVREAFERMWPVLSPAQLLHDLFGSRALLRLAGAAVLDERELGLLHRPRLDDVRDVRWTDADVALLDEARYVLGPKPVRGKILDEDEIRTYGHIVIDEAQDLTPMQLRMAARRSLNGSMTIVGDVAQATGAFAHASWADVLAHLPDRREPRLVQLSVGYRIPESIMSLAARVLSVAAPSLTPPRAVRPGDDPPTIVNVSSPSDLGPAIARQVAAEQAAAGVGSVAVVVPTSMVATIADELDAAGVAFAMASRTGLDRAVSLVPVSLVKGLELDAVIVVEPARILAEEPQGLRSLYVSLTRATRRLALVHAEPLPPILAG